MIVVGLGAGCLPTAPDPQEGRLWGTLLSYLGTAGCPLAAASCLQAHPASLNVVPPQTDDLASVVQFLHVKLRIIAVITLEDAMPIW